MEEQVFFKCRVHWNTGIPDETRRFGIEKTKATSFDFLTKKLEILMPDLAKTKYSVSWRDGEGDDIDISTDDELKIAVSEMPSLVRLHINCTKLDSMAADTAGSNSNAHCGVVCDGCDNGICGFRYKCTTCDDFNLCSKCEAAGLHPEHCMMRVPTPNMPRMIIKAAVKRSRHFLKTVATAEVEERCKKRPEPSSDRKRRGDHGHGHGQFHGHGHRQHGSDHENHRRQRTSWLETFATYMNEFANLAEDVNIDIDKSEPKQTQTQSTQSPKEPTSSSTNEHPNCSFEPAIFDVNNVKKVLNMYFGGLEPTKPSTSKTSEKSKFSETSQTKNNDGEMGQGDRKLPESDKDSLMTDKESLKSEVSSVAESESVNIENPDKIDDWTVINKDRDLMDEKPNDPTPPIGFNLPEKFQECVTISGGSLYPPLNEATAVLKPKEQEVKTAAAKSSTYKPVTSTPPTDKLKDEPRKRHPLRHIDAAIDQMMAMGFTNDGGWLTQLLESKNGNIAAVLDLLTPVNHKK